jgi:hypothetical protein
MKTIKNTTIIILITFLLLEIIIRLCGVKPYERQDFSIESTPELCLIPDVNFGFALNPGEYSVTMNEHIHYTCSHNADSLRVLNDNYFNNKEDSTFTIRQQSGRISSRRSRSSVVSRIDFHGCSFTYGMSVDDSLAFPFLIQKQFSNYEFRNFGVPGFGNLQALLRLKMQIKNKNFPNVLMLCYADFHDERNALNLNYRKSLFSGFQNANEAIQPLFIKSKMPFYDLEKGVQYCDWQTIYKNWSGREYLAAVNMIQDAVEKMQYSAIDEKAVTHQILLEIQQLCEANKIEFILTAITKSESTDFTLAFCKQQNIKTLDIGLPFPSEQYSSLPYDIHPNRLAHQVFAERLKNYLNQRTRLNERAGIE